MSSAGSRGQTQARTVRADGVVERPLVRRSPPSVVLMDDGMALDVEALFTQHHQPLFRYFYRAVGHAETARDLTQDVFVRVARASAPSGNAAEIQAWLFSIARNLLIDHLRRHERSSALADCTIPAVLAGSPETPTARRQARPQQPAPDSDVFIMREGAGQD